MGIPRYTITTHFAYVKYVNLLLYMYNQVVQIDANTKLIKSSGKGIIYF